MRLRSYPDHILKEMETKRFYRLLYEDIQKNTPLSKEDWAYIVRVAKSRTISNNVEQSLIRSNSKFIEDKYQVDELLILLGSEIGVRHFGDDEMGYERDGGNIRRTFPVEVALWNLRSLHNVGAIIRSADCLGVSRVYLCGYTKHDESIKSSMGSSQYVDIQRVEDMGGLLNGLRNKVSIIGVERFDKSKPIEHMTSGFPMLLIFGNEKYGLSEEILKQCDEVLEIPMWGYKYSMNVSNAFAVAVHEMRRRFLEIN